MVGIKDFEMPNTCGDCPYCIHTADEKRYIGYCNTSDDDYYCKALDRFMDYDEVDGGVDILGKPSDCPLVETIPKAEYETRLKSDMVAMFTDIKDELKHCEITGLWKANYREGFNDGIAKAVERISKCLGK